MFILSKICFIPRREHGVSSLERTVLKFPMWKDWALIERINRTRSDIIRTNDSVIAAQPGSIWNFTVRFFFAKNYCFLRFTAIFLRHSSFHVLFPFRVLFPHVHVSTTKLYHTETSLILV